MNNANGVCRDQGAMIVRKLFYFCLLLLFSAAAVFGWLRYSEIRAEDLTDLKNGDILFQTTGSDLTWPIMFASNSLYTHTGILRILPDGTKVVVEAAGPVVETPLEEWISNGVMKRITVMRHRNATADQASNAIAEALKYSGRPYDFFFLMGDDQIYCSELVYKAFLKAGIEIGKKQQVQNLRVANYAVRNYIAKWWYRHPVCVTRNIRRYSDCLNIILEQELVTPVSVARDPGLQMIFTNYVPGWVSGR